MKVSEWADTHRRLSAESSAEAGQWRTDRAPYQRGMLDAVNERNIETVVIMSSAQIGKTEVLNNVVGYYMAQDPAPILVLQPTVEMGKTWSQDRLAPMIRDTPILSGLIKSPRSRDSGNTTMHKSFAGGHITIGGSNSPASLASRPIRLVMADEVDRYPLSAGTEGDPVTLARKRTTTFWNRKIILTSTPTVKGVSRIEMEWEQSDQRRYHVPCPECKTKQTLKWANIQWPENEPKKCHCVCEHCGSIIEESSKPWMLKEGEWIATGIEGKTAGFHINELYSPWRKWSEVVEDFLSAKRSPETLKAWVNTSLGETWEEEAETVEGDSLMSKREAYDLTAIPDDVLILTAGVDVQKDRIEVQVVGWGLDNEPWIFTQKVFYGEPTEKEVWANLDSFLLKTYCGHKIIGVAVDSGYLTEHAYAFTKPRAGRRVFAIKGVSGMGRPLTSTPKQTGRQRVMLYQVGVDTAKRTVYSWLHNDKVHFSADLDEEFFAQLTAEKLVTKFRKGFSVLEWVKTRERNEALDCFVYAYAALNNLNPDLLKVRARKIAPPVLVEEPMPTSTQRKTKSSPKRRSSSFVSRW